MRAGQQIKNLIISTRYNIFAKTIGIYSTRRGAIAWTQE
jgi:hypothetical protein